MGPAPILAPLRIRGLRAALPHQILLGQLREEPAGFAGLPVPGAATAFVTCGEPAVEVDVAVRLATGPEVIAGSTRMKAGTATKLVLNMVSTGAMVRTGRVAMVRGCNGGKPMDNEQ